MKSYIFKAFCCNMYWSHLGCDLKKVTLRRIIVGYNHSFPIILNYYPRHSTESGLFVFNDVLSFNELWRKQFMVLGSVSATPFTRL